MKLTNKQQNYLLSKYKYNAYGDTHSVFIIENDCEVWRKDLTDHTSMHLLTKTNFWWLAVKTSDEKYFDYKKRKFIKEGFKVKETVQILGA